MAKRMTFSDRLKNHARKLLGLTALSILVIEFLSVDETLSIDRLTSLSLFIASKTSIACYIILTYYYYFKVKTKSFFSLMQFMILLTFGIFASTTIIYYSKGYRIEYLETLVSSNLSCFFLGFLYADYFHALHNLKGSLFSKVFKQKGV